MRAYLIRTKSGVDCIIQAKSTHDAMQRWALLDTLDSAIYARRPTRSEILAIAKARVHDYRKD